MRRRRIIQSGANWYRHRSFSIRVLSQLACLGLLFGFLAPVGFLASVASADESGGSRNEGGGPVITPFAGIYVPTRNNIETAEADIKRNNSFVGGAQLTWFPKSPFGLELVGAYSPASTEIAGASVNEERGLAVFLASGRLLFGLSPAVSPVAFFAKAGPAYIRRGVNVTGGAFEEKAEAEFGAVLGVGTRLSFTREVGLRLDADDYIYQGFGGGDVTQHDLVISGGVAFGF
jgi:hypothetical protein